ncbi:MAG: putative MFS-type transporter YfcJ [Holosporales bacterium]
MSSSSSSSISKSSMPTTVWMIGFMMFMSNASFVMIYTFCGVYLKNVAGVSLGVIGILEGISEFASYLTKLLSGVISDNRPKRKPIIVFGVILQVISRLLLAVSPTVFFIMITRTLERLGNGIQSTPRDALVGDITPLSRRGEAYGLKRMVAQAGSLLGAFLGFFVMYYTNDDYVSVFWVASIPCMFALMVLIFFVKEDLTHRTTTITSEIPLPDAKRKHPIEFKNLKRMGRTYWMIILIAAFFMLARFSETLMNLHGHDNFGLAPRFLPMVMVAYNAGHCLISYPIGYIADRMNRYWILALGILMMILSDLFLATAQSMTTFFVGVFFWGLQFGITQNVFTTLIAETVPEDLRGTGFGIYYITCAVSAFIADGLAGRISENFGIQHAYTYGAVVSVIALFVLIFTLGYRPKRS